MFYFLKYVVVLLGTRTTFSTTRAISALEGCSGLINRLDSCKVTKVDGIEHGLGFPINLNVGQFQGTLLRDIVILTLSLLLLKLEGDTTDGTLLDTAHQMGGETSNLVAKTLGWDDGDFRGKALVGLEVEGETGVVLFDKVARGTASLSLYEHDPI